MRRAGIAVLCLTLLGGIGGLVYFVNHQLASQVKEIADLRVSLDGIKSSLEQQTAVMNRAIGNYIPIRLPPQTEETLATIEKRVLQPDQRPQSAKEAEGLRQELVTIVKTLPPWAEQDLLPRLNRLNWSVELLWTIHQDPKSSSSPDTLLERLQSLLDRQPDDAPTELVNLLTTKHHESQVAAERQTRQEALSQANAALKGQGDCAAAWNRLENYSQNDSDLKKVRDSLRVLIVEKAAIDRIALLRSRLKVAKELKDVRQRVSGIVGVQETALGMLLDNMSEKIDLTKVSRDLDELLALCNQELQITQRQQGEEFAKKQRNYQKWALGEIEAFNQAFAEVEVKAKAGGYIGKKWSLQLVDAVQLAMKDHLLTINHGFLEPPVLQLFNEAYTKAWENQAHIAGAQVSVAEKSVTIKKKTLDDIEP